jgi:hypothetical protein
VEVVISGAELDVEDGDGVGVVTAETGQTVVYRAIVDVTTRVECAGQLVTVTGHLVMVYVAVV